MTSYKNFWHTFHRPVVGIESGQFQLHFPKTQASEKEMIIQWTSTLREYVVTRRTFIIDTYEESTTQSRFAILVNLVGSERYFRYSHSFIVTTDNDRSEPCRQSLNPIRNLMYIIGRILVSVLCSSWFYIPSSSGQWYVSFPEFIFSKDRRSDHVRDASSRHEGDDTKIMKVLRYKSNDSVSKESSILDAYTRHQRHDRFWFDPRANVTLTNSWWTKTMIWLMRHAKWHV